MSHFNVTQLLLFSNYQIIKEIPDTKNNCYIISSDHSDLCFLKVFTNHTSAQVEYSLINYLWEYTTQLNVNNKFEFSVPQILELLENEQNIGLVYKYVNGKTASQLLFESNNNPFYICNKLIKATAQIHWLISSNRKIIGLNPITPIYFSPSNDCQKRLEDLLILEGKEILSVSQLTCLLDLQSAFFDILYQKADGFPCDYYKDANPANWIFQARNEKIVAVDFEGDRSVPFFVDLINILEYAANYLDVDQKSTLINKYIKMRIKLEPNLKPILEQYNLDLLLSLFGIYRHQEQMAHRLRDIKAQEKTREWHIQGFQYHLKAFSIHIQLITKNNYLNISQKKVLLNYNNEVRKIYVEIFPKLLKYSSISK